MQVLSCNISQATEIVFNGKTEITGYYKNPVDTPIFLGKNGVEKDTVADKVHHGGPDKACYIYGYNRYAYWQKKYPALAFQYGQFGENITLSNLVETDIHIGDIFQLGKARVQVSQPRQPCYKMGIKFSDTGIVHAFRQTSYCGMYVRVLQEGFVEKGSPVTCLQKAPNSLSLAAVFSLLYTAKPDTKQLQAALENTFLSETIKSYLTKKYSL